MSEQDHTGEDDTQRPSAVEPAAVDAGTSEARANEEPASTGVPAADAARERLTAVDDAPLEQHVDVYEDVHRRLQEGLADLDER